MNVTIARSDEPRRLSLRPLWLTAAGALGFAWSAYGLKQFAESVTASEAHLRSMGMTAEQAALYASLPLWMHAAFAFGVLGALMGCVLLLLRRRQALPVFAASLAGYAVLYAGDIALGIFAAFGLQQVVILTVVLVIAAALLGAAIAASRRRLLV